MRFTVAAASVIAFAASSSASLITVTNNCANSVFLTSTNSAQQTNGPNELKAGANYVTQIVGQGNSLGVTLNSDYYSPNTAKLMLGTSTASGTLYWSVSSVNGNPFAAPSKFSITSPSSSSNDNACGSADSPDGSVKGCADNNVNLRLTLC